MSKEAMKLALEALERMKGYGNVFLHHRHTQNPYEQVCEAITALREALAEHKSGIKQVIELYDSPEQPAPATELREQEPINKYCCHLCFNNTGQLFLDRMILCPECGNKRCPKATHHSLACTKSNDLGQKGSIYDQPAQQEPVERGGLRFYTNGIERQHWKADGSIDFKDKQGNVTMTIAAGSITSSQPSKPLTDEQIMEMYNKVGGATWISDFARAIEAAHGIKENT